ncbi:hypothetical protein NQ318_023147 [Aromia moschata]|uniref:Uncharacterized protein n=1 Tax=Aromia moschata TaxID=1265417 RepID=A0AAV8XDG6_9CUCU|nr:hypothetical protein NQ318_023147 [Aromia moschata]
MRLAIYMAVVGVLHALHCDKEFSYYDSYGNGFDIVCQGITVEHLHLLQNITITNEITLRMEDCSLIGVSSKIFHNVDSIRYLYVENSTFTYPRLSSVFEVLQKLEHLIIRNTNLLVDKYTFAGLTKLKELTLNNNSLAEMEDGSLRNLPSLMHLQLTNNEITDLKNIPLCELRKLRLLDLSKNLISRLNDATFFCRKSSKSVGFNLNNQNHLLNNLNKEDYFTESITSKLQYIDLSYNNISELGSALADLKNLKILHLEKNKLRKIEYKELKALESLEKVYLRNNLLESVDKNIFSNQKNLEYLDLSNNRLVYFSLNVTPLLEHINLADNMLDMFNLDNGNDTSHLKTLILCSNRIRDIQPFAFRRHEAFEHLSIANNNIIELPPFVFRNLTNLKILNLSLNRIKVFKSNNTFLDLINLEVLNISYNLLEELNYALIEPLANLQVLDIAGNRLHHIQYDLIISDLPLLSVFNLKSNMLSCELLHKIIKFLKGKSIGYTITENFDYEQENVGGIHCSSEKNVVPDKLTRDSISSGSYAVIVLGGILGLVLGLILIVVSLFKIHMFLKRRLYKADEFELIDE